MNLDELYYKVISIDDILKLKQFKCGNGTMELFLETEAYPVHIEREASTTLVYYQKQLVGYFTLRHLDMEITPWIERLNYHHSLDIARLAVASTFQGQGIGKEIVNHIIKTATQVNERFITLDALSERYEWYKRMGFMYMYESDITRESNIITMYLDLYDPNIVEAYYDQ